jgi:hypothetical protein
MVGTVLAEVFTGGLPACTRQRVARRSRPEKPLRALQLQVFYSVPSGGQSRERSHASVRRPHRDRHEGPTRALPPQVQPADEAHHHWIVEDKDLISLYRDGTRTGSSAASSRAYQSAPM